jgi:hypothetical protein
MTLARMTMDVPEAKFGAKQKQSDFLIFPIAEGERRLGDAGSSDKWIFQPTRFGKNTASGALQRYYTRELVKESGKSVIVRGGGGVFFGALGGDADDVGFVRRPRRTRARFKMNDKYKQVLARPSDDRIKVKNIGSPQMLAKATKKSEHKSIIDYGATANAAFSQALEDIQRIR